MVVVAGKRRRYAESRQFEGGSLCQHCDLENFFALILTVHCTILCSWLLDIKSEGLHATVDVVKMSLPKRRNDTCKASILHQK